MDKYFTKKCGDKKCNCEGMIFRNGLRPLKKLNEKGIGNRLLFPLSLEIEKHIRTNRQTGDIIIVLAKI